MSKDEVAWTDPDTGRSYRKVYFGKGHPKWSGAMQCELCDLQHKDCAVLDDLPMCIVRKKQYYFKLITNND